MICIHSEFQNCKIYHHTCSGEIDALACAEWRTIQALDQLSKSIRGLIQLQPGGKLIFQGLN